MTNIRNDTTLARRAAGFAYAVIAYAVGMAALGWLVATLGGLVPWGVGPLETRGPGAALAVNAGLVVLFGVQHSAMARRRFKAWWTQFISPALERSTYVLAAGLALGLVLWLWQPMPGAVWSVSSELARKLMWGVFVFGWLYLVAATFVTNHFDLFGLRQAWLHLRGQRYVPVRFTRSWMYRYSRHPMMAGILVGLWAVPTMRVDHFVFAIGFSAYVAVGIAFEERGLLRHFGETYRAYRAEVGLFLPRLRSAGARSPRGEVADSAR
jgi:protein-S-isoprenylcysteine O-methyltransferase Ste14